MKAGRPYLTHQMMDVTQWSSGCWLTPPNLWCRSQIVCTTTRQTNKQTEEAEQTEQGLELTQIKKIPVWWVHSQPQRAKTVPLCNLSPEPVRLSNRWAFYLSVVAASSRGVCRFQIKPRADSPTRITIRNRIPFIIWITQQRPGLWWIPLYRIIYLKLSMSTTFPWSRRNIWARGAIWYE